MSNIEDKFRELLQEINLDITLALVGQDYVEFLEECIKKLTEEKDRIKRLLKEWEKNPPKPKEEKEGILFQD